MVVAPAVAVVEVTGLLGGVIDAVVLDPGILTSSIT